MSREASPPNGGRVVPRPGSPWSPAFSVKLGNLPRSTRRRSQRASEGYRDHRELDLPSRSLLLAGARRRLRWLVPLGVLLAFRQWIIYWGVVVNFRHRSRCRNWRFAAKDEYSRNPLSIASRSTSLRGRESWEMALAISASIRFF
jgi:hypothetical protein